MPEIPLIGLRFPFHDNSESAESIQISREISESDFLERPETSKLPTFGGFCRRMRKPNRKALRSSTWPCTRRWSWAALSRARRGGSVSFLFEGGEYRNFFHFRRGASEEPGLPGESHHVFNGLQ